MAIVVRHRCARCGAYLEGDAHAGPWVRCPSCDGLVDFDWQSFFDSDAYAELIKNAEANAEGWKRYEALLTDVARLGTGGDRDAALARCREAIEIEMTLIPFAFPPGAETPSRYRKDVVEFHACWTLESKIDPTLVLLGGELTATLQSMDYKDPLPTIERVVGILREQHARVCALAMPPDPDGLSPEQRFRVWSGMTLGAYLPMLTPPQRLEIVRSVYGAENVREVGGDDELGTFIDWTCPACGLTSLQARTAASLECLGCHFRRPFRAADLLLPEIETACPSCGAEVRLAAGAIETACAFCGTVATRLGRSGRIERALARSYVADADADALPDDGVPGLEVTPANRGDRVLDGLWFMTIVFGPYVAPGRLADAFRRSFAAIGIDEDEGLGRIRTRLSAERAGGEDRGAALEALEAIAGHLAARPRATGAGPGSP